MKGVRPLLVALGLAVVALVVQATIFRRFRWLTPDLEVLVVIVVALSLRPELTLFTGFFCGVLVDVSVGNSLMGLRALTYTAVAFVAIRTRQRAEAGTVALAIWAGALTLLSVLLFALVGALFGQANVAGANLVRRVIQVPLANLVLAAVLAAPITRLLHVSGRRA
jgi:rod shape-determining protein MreD